MKLSQFLDTWKGVLLENRFHRISTLLLCVLAIILAHGWSTRSTTVVMVPPTLDGPTSISTDAASSQLKVQWGLYVVTMLGNVTPNTAPYLKKSLGDMLMPDIYRTVMDAIDNQVDIIKRDRLVTSFSPRVAKLEPKSGLVKVIGDLTTTDVQGTRHRSARTYMVGIRVQNFKVLVDYLAVTNGEKAR
jgi:conjugal transfer pilus assembly protein TraE